MEKKILLLGSNAVLIRLKIKDREEMATCRNVECTQIALSGEKYCFYHGANKMFEPEANDSYWQRRQNEDLLNQKKDACSKLLEKEEEVVEILKRIESKIVTQADVTELKTAVSTQLDELKEKLGEQKANVVMDAALSDVAIQLNKGMQPERIPQEVSIKPKGHEDLMEDIRRGLALKPTKTNVPTNIKELDSHDKLLQEIGQKMEERRKRMNPK